MICCKTEKLILIIIICLLDRPQINSGLIEDAHRVIDPAQHKNWNNLDHENCGFSFAKRIVGGKETGLGEFPWLVLLGYEFRHGDRIKIDYDCGGALLNPYYVLTAGHCIEDVPTKPIVIRAGEHDLEKKKECKNCGPPPQDRKIQSFLLHPNFNISNQHAMKNDIALIKVKEPFYFNAFVRSICLPNKEIGKLDFTHKRADVAGFGLSDNHFAMYKMRDVKVTIDPESVCLDHFGEGGFEARSEICAEANSRNGPCIGDSGGPLMKKIVSKRKAQFYVIGIVSYGPSPCGTVEPSVFTRTSYYIKWILDNITH